MSNPARPQNHVSRETYDEFAELQFTEPQNPREVDSVGEFYRDEVDAPSALLTRMRVAASLRIKSCAISVQSCPAPPRRRNHGERRAGTLA